MNEDGIKAFRRHKAFEYKVYNILLNHLPTDIMTGEAFEELYDELRELMMLFCNETNEDTL